MITARLLCHVRKSGALNDKKEHSSPAETLFSLQAQAVIQQ